MMTRLKRMRSTKTTKMMKRKRLMRKFVVVGRRRRNAEQEFVFLKYYSKFINQL